MSAKDDFPYWEGSYLMWLAMAERIDSLEAEVDRLENEIDELKQRREL